MRTFITLMGIIAFAASGARARILSTAFYNNHTYHLLEEADWYISEAEAVRLGGHLVTINDAEENTWILETFGQMARDRGGNILWLGFNDADTEAKWQWSSGELTNFVNWQSGQPENILPTQDFAGMILSNSADSEFVIGKWRSMLHPPVHNWDNCLGLVEIVPEPNDYIETSIYNYNLPIPKSDARGFFTYQDRLYILDYPDRTLYCTENTRLYKV